MKIGSHVGMSGKEMMLGSVKEALSYGANTFMLYTGAPQNTRRKDVSELRVEEAWELMRANDITEFVVHAPYIINLANTVKPEIYQLAVRADRGNGKQDACPASGFPCECRCRCRHR